MIPAFNASTWIVETLRSVLEQDVPEIEVILVDDGSTDDTAKLVTRISENDQRLRIMLERSSRGRRPRSRRARPSRRDGARTASTPGPPSKVPPRALPCRERSRFAGRSFPPSPPPRDPSSAT
ncbi:MAG: glycosyltransferase family 2 protein [Alphaproteobacteria bacterium]